MHYSADVLTITAIGVDISVVVALVFIRLHYSADALTIAANGVDISVVVA